MWKKILMILSGLVVLLGGMIFLIYKTCDITFTTDKVFSSDGTYYIQAQNTECVLLDRYTTDVIITYVKHSFLEKVKGDATEDVLILRGDNPTIKSTWVDDRTIKVKYAQCRGVYGKIEKWRDIEIIFEGKCSENH